jgi:acyl dehydratase
MENWHRIHYDHPFATRVDGLPDVLVNGSWKQQVMCQYVKDLLGPDGWLWKVRFQFREMDPSGNAIIAGGQVLEAAEHEGLGYVLLEIHLANQTGAITTRGAAIGVVPVPAGPAVPYPFVPPDRSPVTW